METGNWFAGIDAGGTATKGWLYQQGVGLMARGVGPAGNFYVAGANGVADAVWQTLNEAARGAGLKGIPPLKSLAACVAGARGTQEHEAIQGALAHTLSVDQIRVYPDAAAGLMSGTLGDPGVVVIAGTGSTVWALSKEGVWQRAGGWGYLLGDEGSGFSIGLTALKAVVKAVDGRDRPTALVEAIMDEWGLAKLHDLLPIVYAQPIPRQRIAALAPVVMHCAQKGDAVAKRIVRDHVGELVELAQIGVALASLADEIAIIVVGGVFEDADVLAQFTTAIQRNHPGAKVVRPDLDPAAGACILALQKAGVWTAQEQEILLQSYSSSPI